MYICGYVYMMSQWLRPGVLESSNVLDVSQLSLGIQHQKFTYIRHRPFNPVSTLSAVSVTFCPFICLTAFSVLNWFLICQGRGVRICHISFNLILIIQNIFFYYLHFILRGFSGNLQQTYSWRRKWHPNFNILACKIPQTREPRRLHFMGSQRVGYDLVSKQQQ